MDRITAFLKNKETYYALCCYFLGGLMMLYGLKKMNLGQCIIFPFSAWRQSLANLQGPQLTWAFLGYSGWFQFLIGFFEFAPSILLFFRRTSLLGAILLLPMTLGVFLINHSMHLWAMTNRLSLGLLILNLLIFIFEWGRIRDMLFIVIGRGQGYGIPKWWTIVKILVLLIVLLGFEIKDYTFSNTNLEFCGDWRHNHPNEWLLASEAMNDSLLPPHPFTVYFMPTGAYSEFNEQCPNARGYIMCDIDKAHHNLNFKWLRYGNNEGNFHHFNGIYQYAFTGDSILTIRSKANNMVPGDPDLHVETANPIHCWVFKRQVINRAITKN